MTAATGHLLTRIGLPQEDPGSPPRSPHRFADGASYRFEIPSTEGPACLRAALDIADELDVPIRRFSQGSGVFMLTDAELDAMAAIGASRNVEISLFARPVAGWQTSASAVAPAGGALFNAVRGADQLRDALDDICRAAAHGIRSVLISDIGLLSAFGQLRQRGDLPADMKAKVSVMLPAANPATARVLADLGADTLNLPADLSLSQIAAIRSVVSLPIDMYVEAPDSLGGFIRHHEVPRLIEIAAPIYVKLGLRNAPDLYPSGTHIEATAIALTRERVRRARLVLEMLIRSGLQPPATAGRSGDLAVPALAGEATSHAVLEKPQMPGTPPVPAAADGAK
jgi:hypothetical protein